MHSRAISYRFYRFKRIEAAEVVDLEAPRAGQAKEKEKTRAFFGATVRYAFYIGINRLGINYHFPS